MMRSLTESLWYAAYVGLAKWLPRSSAKVGGSFARWLRQLCCRRFVAYCGSDVNIERGATFGRRVWIGNSSDLGINCRIHGELHIGNYSFMGPDVVVWTKNHRFSRSDIPIKYQGYSTEKPVNIGDDVWIGTKVILLSGASIGNHAVIGAGAVVAKSIPEWAIVVGNPARVVGYRRRDQDWEDGYSADASVDGLPASGVSHDDFRED